MYFKPKVRNLLNFISEYESVNRFSRNHLVRPENLVHHVGVTSIICAFLLNKMSEEYEEELFSSQECCSLMMRAVVHDMDEIITGDIVRPTKYASSEILTLLKRLEEESIGKVIEKFDLPVRWEEDWRQAKKDRVGMLLKMADTLAVVMTCYREVTLYSNNQFVKVAQEAHQHIREMAGKLSAQIPESDEKTQKIYSFLLDFIIQGQSVLEEIIPKEEIGEHEYE
jgi:5'-deoxynucleotidase YfbR-like HD superfamily hydrolase